MAIEGDKLEYRDLISPDGSINELISQLERLSKTYGAMISGVKVGAKSISISMKQLKSTTSEARAEIDEAAAAADRLERAEKELKFAMSDIGKEVAWVKAQTASVNKTTVAHARQVEALAGSYDKIKAELDDNVRLWKSLSDSERASADMGGQVLATISELTGKLSELNSQLRPTVTRLTEVQKAEQKLAFLQSEEGQRLLELKRQINEITSGRKTEKVEIDKVTRAYSELMDAKSEEAVKLAELNQQRNEAVRIAKLTAQINNSAEGSYNQLAAQYELNKIKLNAMSQAERNATDTGKALEAETLDLYKRMIALQEATGNHKLSVGNYIKAFDGLRFSVFQIVREIPAATINMETFFLAISNNLPILADEIARVNAKNKAAIANGKKAVSIIGQIGKAVFSWNTLLMLGAILLITHGKQIVDWTKNIIFARREIGEYEKALSDIAKETENSNANYGKNIVTLKKLQKEWKELSNVKDQLKWIDENKSKFDELDISITNVNDAENLLIENTDDFIASLRARAKAEAGYKLASEKYEQALIRQAEADAKITASPSMETFVKKNEQGFYEITPEFTRRTDAYNEALRLAGEQGSKLMEVTTADSYDREAAATINNYYRARIEALGTLIKASETQFVKEITKVSDEAEKLQDEGNRYFELAFGFEQLDNTNKSKKDKTGGSEDKKRDLTDIIYRNDITLQRKYEESITKLQRDEYAKRRKEAMHNFLDEKRQLEEKLRKNKEYIANVDGKYEGLTEKQKEQIRQQNIWIAETIANGQKQLQFELSQIEKERQINSLVIMRETLDQELGIIEESINEEKELRLEQLENEKQLVLETNKNLEEGARSEAEIIAEYTRKRLVVETQYANAILKLKKDNIDAQLELVQKGSQEELDLLLRQNELELQQALNENTLKPAAERQDEAIITQVYQVKATRIRGEKGLESFDEGQSLAEAQFNAVKHNEYEITKFKLSQEIARWNKQIALAESGSLNWSKVQIDTAKETVKGLERELDEATSFTERWAEKGLGGALLERLGFDDDQISALEDAASEIANAIVESLQAIYEAEVELAEKQVELAEERVDAAQSALDAEIEARNNGYANNVATAKKELQLEKQNQLEKQRLLEEAQRKQEAVDTVMQASNLITGVSAIWATSMKLGPIAGPIIAGIVTATMFGAFLASKIKAAEATKASQAYGEGGLEILDGGSHASGNDIDLNTRNSKGKNMRAEGGEAMAIINRHSTRKYRKQLPCIIKALNSGTFEDKYLQAFKTGEMLQNYSYTSTSDVNLSTIESELTEIKRQGRHRIYMTADGITVIIDRNVKRFIK